MGIYIGLDIGGTKFMVHAVDEKGSELKRVKYDTPVDFNEGVELLHHMIETVSKGETILGIGAAAGGPLNSKTGIISPLHQPEWRNVNLRDIMESRWNCPFYVDVDTNVAALGEYSQGSYVEKFFLYVTLSTGMGGGFLVNGKVYEGLSHPEIAHQSADFRCAHPERIHCACGAKNCLEALVSGGGIAKIYQKRAENLNSDEWAEVAYNLSVGLRNIATILSPEVIVFGGGVAVGGGEEFLRLVEKEMIKNLHLVKAPKLVLSKYGYDTALFGASYIAKHGAKIYERQA